MAILQKGAHSPPSDGLCYGNQFYKFNNRQKSNRQNQEYVVSSQVHTDLDNLLISIRDKKVDEKSALVKLDAFIDKAEADGVLIRNLGAVTYFENRTDLYRTGDFSLNCANPATAKILKESASLDHLTLSYDLNVNQLLDMLDNAPADWFELTLHQHMPMFHMEHCVFCTFMSKGTSYKDCGRPCEKHKVQLRDRVGQLHTLAADVGCRNTLFNGRAQTGARYYNDIRSTGLSRYRIDFLDEDKTDVALTLQAYQKLLAGKTDGELLWQDLEATDRLGVTEGTLEVKF